MSIPQILQHVLVHACPMQHFGYTYIKNLFTVYQIFKFH